jgi:hypothetical protein
VKEERIFYYYENGDIIVEDESLNFKYYYEATRKSWYTEADNANSNVSVN